MKRPSVAVALFLSVVFGGSQALAHDVRPAYLEMTESTPGTFDVVWKMPVLGGRMLPLSPVLPDSCKDLAPPSVLDTPGARIQRWTVHCGEEGLVGQSITIDGLPLTLTDALIRVSFADGAVLSQIVNPSAPSFVLSGEEESSVPVWGYLRLGVDHILMGIDHLLFVLALLLIVQGPWLLVKTITSFTVAHSISLALAALGFVNVPGPPVDAVIALSIVFMGSELLRVHRGEKTLTARHPWIAAFGFGLLHGLGFAGALTALGLPASDIPLALLLFNIGVEIGQLLFVGLALALFASFLQLELRWPIWGEAVPAYTIGSLASFWLIGRVIVMF